MFIWIKVRILNDSGSTSMNNFQNVNYDGHLVRMHYSILMRSKQYNRRRVVSRAVQNLSIDGRNVNGAGCYNNRRDYEKKVIYL